MTRKVIYGVEHSEQEELDGVLSLLDGRSDLEGVGLELPSDYGARAMFGVVTGFFNDIAVHLLDSKRAAVYPLEAPKVIDFHRAIELAMAVKEGKLSYDEFRSNLAGFRFEDSKNSFFTAPEVRWSNDHYLKMYDTARKILNKDKTLENITQRWNRSNARRNRYMLRNIEIHKPELVIVGDGHAQALENMLPKYDYLRFS